MAVHWWKSGPFQAEEIQGKGPGAGTNAGGKYSEDLKIE